MLLTGTSTVSLPIFAMDAIKVPLQLHGSLTFDFCLGRMPRTLISATTHKVSWQCQHCSHVY